MDFGIDPARGEAVDGFRRYLAREIAPLAREYRDRLMPADVLKAQLGRLRGFGLVDGWAAPEFGGQGIDYLTSGLLYEELARVFPDLAGAAFIAEGAATNLANLATATVRERYLPAMLAGELIGCHGITEPGGGSNPRQMRTRAVREAGGWRISGEKTWISNGGVSDVCTVVARTADNGFTRFLVDRREHGYRSVEIPKLGLQAWSTAQLYFDDLLVPDENVVGVLHEGLKATLMGFERARTFTAVFAVGIMQAALDASIAYARDRHQFGKPIAAHQLVQDMLAEIATLLESSRLLVHKALDRLARGQPATVESSMAKQYATESAVRATSLAIQVHGAYGLAAEFPLERHFRNARMLTIPDGTTQINRLIVARALLDVSAF